MAERIEVLLSREPKEQASSLTASAGDEWITSPVTTTDQRIFIYPDALLADISVETSDTNNRRMQNGVGLGPASCHDP